MSTPENVSKKGHLSRITEATVIAFAFALIVTACGWLWVGKTSPFNHGVAYGGVKKIQQLLCCGKVARNDFK